MTTRSKKINGNKWKMGVNGGTSGRPNNTESPKLIAELLEYFEEGCSILYTSKHSKHNKKTVEKYWKKFRAEKIFDITESFIGRQRNAREAALGEIDELIDKANEEVEESKKARDEFKGKPQFQTVYIHALEFLTSLILKRYALDMVPTVDVNLDKIIAEEGYVYKTLPESIAEKAIVRV